MKDKMTKLNPCPKCGSSEIDIMGDSWNCDVACQNCGLTTNIFAPGPNVEEYATKHWNEKINYGKWIGTSDLKKVETADYRCFVGRIDDTIEYLKEIKLEAERENLNVFVTDNSGEIKFEYYEKEVK